MVFRWLLVGGYALLLFAFSAQQESGASTMNSLIRSWFPNLSRADIQLLVVYIRKMGHVLAYFIATILVYYAARITRGIRRHPQAFAALVALALAGLDEYYQASLPHRTGTIYDVLIDGIGIIAAVTLIYIVIQRRESSPGAEEIRRNEEGTTMRTNKEKLVELSVLGVVTPPLRRGAYRIDRDGVPFVLPGTGGITYNVKVGDCAFGWAGDHVEPCVSTAAVGDANRTDPKNSGYNVLSCIGNKATVVSGEAKGAVGIVTGTHGGIEHVLIDFPDEALEKMCVEDKIQIRTKGQGLSLLDYPGITVLNTDPSLLEQLNIVEKDGTITVPVVKRVPARFMGSGIGAPDTASGDYDITTSDQEEVKELGLDTLKFGDLVALEDCDNRFGRSYKRGALTIGVVVHSDCLLAGHGPGVTTLLTAADGTLLASEDCEANIGKMLGIGRYRAKSS